MKLRSGFLGFVLLWSFMSSCIGYERITIEVYKPASYSIPPNIRKIALISRNLKYANDTLQNYQSKNHQLIKDKNHISTDSLAITTCLDSLANQLVMHNTIDSITTLPVSVCPLNRVKEVRPAKIDWYKKIVNASNVDGLIILDMFSCFYSQETNCDSPSANIVTSNIWSFYDANQQKITDRHIQIDTLFWDRYDEKGYVTNKNIPGKKEAVVLASGVIGKNYSKHIVPSWNMVYRDIMVSKAPETKEAFRFAKNNEWEKAITIWQKYADNKNRKNKIIGLYNLALSHEMNGEIDRAIGLISQATELSFGLFLSSENEAIKKYQTVLYQRKIEIQKLELQYETH